MAQRDPVLSLAASRRGACWRWRRRWRSPAAPWTRRPTPRSCAETELAHATPPPTCKAGGSPGAVQAGWLAQLRRPAPAAAGRRGAALQRRPARRRGARRGRRGGAEGGRRRAGSRGQLLGPQRRQGDRRRSGSSPGWSSRPRGSSTSGAACATAAQAAEAQYASAAADRARRSSRSSPRSPRPGSSPPRAQLQRRSSAR